ncbi:DUF397 domain-containing protein [Streptomyces sp. NPDC000229]|uniref:DUF397 domain-containing protein n=1 Tax=Streptomyces sp. NPDC000229 TaxID=3154247 RepID=UPI0033220226
MSSTLRWFKSSYSSDSGGECVEVAFDWRTSSYSSSSGGECVEVAVCPHTVHVRDSKNPDGPALALAPAAWGTFLDWAE